MSGRLALNLYGYLISSTRTPSVQALFGEHCFLFADSFGEWCSGPKRKHSRRCLLLMKISLHASVHSQSRPSAPCAFTQSFSERCPTTVHLWARRFFNCFVRKKSFLMFKWRLPTSPPVMRNSCWWKLQYSRSSRTPWDASHNSQHKRSRSSSQKWWVPSFCPPQETVSRQLSTPSMLTHAHQMVKWCLAFNILFIRVSTHLKILFVFCKPRNSFSSSSHRFIIDQKAASEHHSIAWCMQRESGGRAILNVYKVHGRAILNDKVSMFR